MNESHHEQIQRFVSGRSDAEEIAALQGALSGDSELRALFVDYMNLDAALSAMADVAVPAEGDAGRVEAEPQRIGRSSPHFWRWVAATAACAAIAMLGVRTKPRDAAPKQPDFALVTASAHAAISRLPSSVPPVLPAWMSPTASLLEQPGLPK